VAVKAVQARNRALLSQAMVAGSPIEERAMHVIKNLLNDRVVDRSVVRLLDARVLSTTPIKAKVASEMILSPCFRTEQGRDVTDSPDHIRQSAVWTMRRTGDEWRLYDAKIKRGRARGAHARCP
jgi:hypothetical protein